MRYCREGKANKQILGKELEITGCKRSVKRCVFKKGENARISIPFTPQTPISSLKAEVHGLFNGLQMPFKLEEPEACGRSLECPVKANSTVTYVEELPVLRMFPSLSLRVKYALIDQNGDTQICVIFPVKLQ